MGRRDRAELVISLGVLLLGIGATVVAWQIAGGRRLRTHRSELRAEDHLGRADLAQGVVAD